MKVETYVFFNGNCEEAAEFYRKVLGAEVQFMMRFKDSPDPHPPGMLPPGFESKVMHMNLKIGDSVVMASDGGGCNGGGEGFQGFHLSIALDDKAEAERIFKALGEGGKINMPLGETFFAHAFGMLVDKFGMGWMVLVEKKMN